MSQFLTNWGVVLLCLLVSIQTSYSATTRPPVNRKMAQTVFANAGKKAGLEIWRVENFSPVVVSKDQFGKFYEGDSYVVLKTKENKGTFSWDIHYWLGSKTSQDESGSAAILAVELDDSLNGSPVQHRETQDHETQLFLSYFPAGVRYLPGGVKSGFNHVETNAPTGGKKLYQIKGKRNIRIRQVEPKISAMNKGDAFILDAGNTIYVYNGVQSKRTERLKAISAANQIRDQDHAGRAKVNIIDDNATQDEVAAFFTALGGGSRAQIPDEATGGSDDDFEKNADSQVTLYKISDASGKLKVEPVSRKPLQQNALNTDDAFILDTVTSGLFVWNGRKATKAEKEEALKKGEEFLKSKNYPKWTQITRVIENGEPSTFKQWFSDWRSSGDRAGLGRGKRDITIEQLAVTLPDPSNITPKQLQVMVKNSGPAMTFLPDNGDGNVEVFRVENFELIPVEKEQVGLFFGGDSYVVKYNYDGNKYIIYYWLGKDSTLDERAAAALHTIRMDSELGGAATQVRVSHGEEPRHFNKIFKGKLVILTGGKASGFKNLQDKDSIDVDGTRLFRIRGTEADDVRAEQLPEVASSLDSNDSFLLETPSGSFVWFGKSTSEEERNMAQNVNYLLESNNIPTYIEEGEEPEEFWENLGGQDEYSKPREEMPVYSPRLFHIYVPESGITQLEELYTFNREDLASDDVLVADSGDEVYIWVGKGASMLEIKEGINYAHEYLEKDFASRQFDVIVLIHEGNEPVSFTSLFTDW